MMMTAAIAPCSVTTTTMTATLHGATTMTTILYGMMIVPITPLVVATQAHLSLFMVMVVAAS